MTSSAPDSTIDVTPCGPGALRVVSQSGDAERDWRRVHGLARWLADADVARGFTSIPTYDSVLVEFDAASMTSVEAEALVQAGLTQARDTPMPPGRHFDVPVLYGPPNGPDLEHVADLEGLTVDELVAAHTGKTYVIRCFGSPAASPMMDAPNLPRPVPRLASPRPSVPQGVVSLAGRQAVIAPASAPGGWQVIGRTPLVLLRPDAEPLVPYRPGDTVRFYVIDADEFEARRGEPMVPAPC